MFVDGMSADVENLSPEILDDRCSSKLFTVHSFDGHNGIITAVAMSESVLISARSFISFILQRSILNLDCYYLT